MSTKNSLQTEDPLTLEAVLEVKTGVVIGSLYHFPFKLSLAGIGLKWFVFTFIKSCCVETSPCR